MNKLHKAGQKSPQKVEKGKNPHATHAEQSMNRIEFHRNALALLPDPSDKRPGIAIFSKDHSRKELLRHCSCALAAKRTCPHIREFAELFKALEKRFKHTSFDDEFRASIWHRMAAVIVEGANKPLESINMNVIADGDRNIVKISEAAGRELLSYYSQGPDRVRFIERCMVSVEKDTVPSRGIILNQLSHMTYSENERMMLDRGFKTRRLAMEESVWYRIAYHCHREFPADACAFHPAVEESTGSFFITCDHQEQGSLFRIRVPRAVVRAVIQTFGKLLPNQHDMMIHPIPLKSLFHVTMNTELDLEVRPLIEMIQESGEKKFFDREDLEHYRYGDLVFIKELGMIAELEKPGRERKFRAPTKMVLKKSQIPLFLDAFSDEIDQGRHIIDEKVKHLRIIKTFDRIDIHPAVIERDWCWLAMEYGFGTGSISLAEILKAREEGQRFIGVSDGWIDCQSLDVEDITDPLTDMHVDAEDERIKLSRIDLLRLQAMSSLPFTVKGDDESQSLLHKILTLRPSYPVDSVPGMASDLWDYQKKGVEWLLFLFENGLGGLLCDEMGLGKTHQVMALMQLLRDRGGIDAPFLVVCPTTVLSHWKRKIHDHIPTLKATIHHGGQRSIDEACEENDVIVTSYGILRNDIEELQRHSFSVAVFDEIHYIKNQQTLGYQAAQAIRAGSKLGLTGTPIENSLMELKALMDLTVPGYLGNDRSFEERYMIPIQQHDDGLKRVTLRRLTSPFTLRRRKSMVLQELPEKIEDIRTCSLSDDQVKLYRDAIASRGSSLIKTLQEGSSPVPYIHIFALLNLLKQICNHPALLDGGSDGYHQYESGKWELFKELLAEGLGSGQKVVVYSQYLTMLKIMEQYLTSLDIDYVTLTGKSRNRGDIIDRFNNDPECRVYIGSLKAGGVGIDLVSASVVIHYDRWWNAAKEDQATDRVHRIGQQRGVQVFKLVTEGTLEEKISAIIEKKRKLMESIIKEDDPGLLKTFTREELIEMLAEPTEERL